MGLLDPWLAAAPLAEKLRGLPPGSVAGLLSAEGTAPGVVSNAGATTPLQILPSTARSMNMDPRFLAQHPDAATNAGAAYLSQQLGQFGNMSDAYAAYNAGPGGAQQWINAGRPDSFPVKNGDIGKYVQMAGGGAPASGDLLNDFDKRGNSGQPGASAAGSSLLADFDNRKTQAAPSPPQGGNPASALPPAPQSFGNDMTAAGSGMMNSLVGPMQGTTPVMGNLQGKQAYGDPIGVFGGVDDANQPIIKLPDGTARYMDPTKEVILYGPDGKPAVYARSADTDIGKLNSIGHILSFGALTGGGSIPPSGAAAPSALQEGVQAFNQAGIRPSSIGAASGTRLWQAVHGGMKDFFPTAGPVSRADNAMLGDTKAAVGTLAQKYGEPGTNLDAGAALQTGADAFRGMRRSPDLPPLTQAEKDATLLAPTRNTSFAQKSSVLYGRLDSMVPANTQASAPNLVSTLQRTQTRFENPDLAQAFADPQMKKWLGAITTSGGKLSWSDLRNFRTQVGKLLAKPVILNDQDTAELKSLYGAATQDMQATAAATGGDSALLALNRADQYYSAGASRIKSTLGQILKEGTSDESAFNILMKTTKAGSALENASKLTALRRSIPDEQWGDVAATVIGRLGEPVASAKAGAAAEAAGFSPQTFMRNYNNLSGAAKDVLFGSGANRYELDNLVKVVNREAGLGKLESTSHSAGPGMIMAATGGMITRPVETVLGALGSNVAARVMTNARFVRWLGRTAPQKTVAWPQKIAQLGQLAKFDTSLQEPFQILSRQPAFADQNNGQSR